MEEGDELTYDRSAYEMYHAVSTHVNSGYKESQFYSLPFGLAVASMYSPKHHFN